MVSATENWRCGRLTSSSSEKCWTSWCGWKQRWMRLVGNGQPGRVKLVEDKVAVLERNDLRNSVHNRLVNGAISAAISVAIALHKYWLK